MRFYTTQHRFYCGIDLHARSMYLLNEAKVPGGRPRRCVWRRFPRSPALQTNLRVRTKPSALRILPRLDAKTKSTIFGIPRWALLGTGAIDVFGPPLLRSDYAPNSSASARIPSAAHAAKLGYRTVHGQGGNSGGMRVQVRWTTATRPSSTANSTSSQSCRRARVRTGNPNSGCPAPSSRCSSRSMPATCAGSTVTKCQGTSHSTP